MEYQGNAYFSNLMNEFDVDHDFTTALCWCSGCTQEYNLHHPIILDEATDFFNKHGVSDFTFDTCRLWGWRCRAKLAVSLSSVVCFSTLDFEEGFSRSRPWFNPLFGSNLNKFEFSCVFFK
ncbi:uncharacterized protein LOC114318348 [Camellia sinensis]|uniref:uncharacterized protein LOC114318348 n=1 Tax=Camellia sinensis TaxID=4442 RepID=UPI001035FBF3|nr:uncharacterized protein LOC114318348 [Camellia sinensis]